MSPSLKSAVASVAIVMLWTANETVGRGPAAAAEATAKITEQEINAAQQAWCDALVKIGKTHADGGDYKTVATQALTDLYDYDHGKVFFKPTLAHGKNTFRPTKAGALAYFVGHNPDFPDDTGFALKP